MSALSLAPRALYEEVAELLRQRIFARELEPGSWIDELRIAEALGISRTPLREALKVLAAEGLVTMEDLLEELFGPISDATDAGDSVRRGPVSLGPPPGLAPEGEDDA